jgi:hypothetical protein
MATSAANPPSTAIAITAARLNDHAMTVSITAGIAFIDAAYCGFALVMRFE